MRIGVKKKARREANLTVRDPREEGYPVVHKLLLRGIVVAVGETGSARIVTRDSLFVA